MHVSDCENHLPGHCLSILGIFLDHIVMMTMISSFRKLAQISLFPEVSLHIYLSHLDLCGCDLENAKFHDGSVNGDCCRNLVMQGLHLVNFQ